TTTPTNPTQSDNTSQCGAYKFVAPGDDCFTENQRFNMSAGKLWEWNTNLDEACTNLWLIYDVCVAAGTLKWHSADGTC
ncbi:hypothetical protein LZ32DRAFT_544923, partial [Colletotrichum eremochloae]